MCDHKENLLFVIYVEYNRIVNFFYIFFFLLRVYYGFEFSGGYIPELHCHHTHAPGATPPNPTVTIHKLIDKQGRYIKILFIRYIKQKKRNIRLEKGLHFHRLLIGIGLLLVHCVQCLFLFSCFQNFLRRIVLCWCCDRRRRFLGNGSMRRS